MQSTSLRDRVESITRDNLSLTQQEINRIIYRTLLQEGYTFTDISRVINNIPITTTSTISLVSAPGALSGCPTNDDGDVIGSITLDDTIPEDLLKEGRKYAQKKNTSLNALIREALMKLVGHQKSVGNKDYLKLAKKFQVNSGGYKFNREDVYADI